MEWMPIIPRDLTTAHSFALLSTAENPHHQHNANKIVASIAPKRALWLGMDLNSETTASNRVEDLLC